MNITASVVSHGHGAHVTALMEQFAQLSAPHLRRVLVTLNLPEPELLKKLSQGNWPFELKIIQREQPFGFGANHNWAFREEERYGDPHAFFAVINPDIVLLGDPFQRLCEAMCSDAQIGVSYPVQVAENGLIQDYERLLPTPWRLFKRYFLGKRQEISADERAQWVNAAFLLLRRQAFAEIQGFDERFHMYCEDVDLCVRLQLAGWSLARVPQATVMHPAQRASHREFRYLTWHLRSLWRLWHTPGWRAWREMGKS